MWLRLCSRHDSLPRCYWGQWRCIAGTSTEERARAGRAAIAEDVKHRRPEVARKRLIEGLNEQGRHFFAHWLNQKDRIFRESVHQSGFWRRWMRASTTDMVFDFRSWHRAQDPYRYIKICLTPMGWLRSDLVRRLAFPDLAIVACSSTSVCIFNVCIAPPGCVLSLPAALFTITSMAVGLLVTFRTQMSYGRYDEAVHLWSTTRADVRELCGRILARIPSPRPASSNDDIWRKRTRGAKLAQTFPHALKYHLSITGQNANFGFTSNMTDAAVYEKKLLYFRDELLLFWDYDDPEERAIVDRLLETDVRNWPLQVCQELTHLNANAYCAPNAGGLGHPNSEGLDQLIRSLQRVTAESERILQTPIYTPYTVFTSRIIYLWSNIMSLGVFELVGPFATPPVTLAMAFLLFGIDHIGMRVESPFHMLPMWQYVQNIDNDCEQLLRNSRRLQ